MNIVRVSKVKQVCCNVFISNTNEQRTYIDRRSKVDFYLLT
jgi:hypothetical protein